MMEQPRTPMPGAELLAQFAAIVGPANALTAPHDQAPYLREWRDHYVGRTPVVLRPSTVAEVSAIMALAHASGTAVVPQSGNTGLVGGQIPFEHGHEVLLNLSRLDRIRAVDASGDTMTVEAGVTLAAVQQAAATAGRLFPLSLASEGSCRIGGVLGTNAGGVGVLAYGNARDLTLGLEVVLADGRMWDGLTALRKDNTGYDLRHLFVGSEGTLGIITAAVLKLFARPTELATAFVGLPSLEAARDLFRHARASCGPALTAFEILPRLGIDFVTRHMPNCRDPLTSSHPWYALVEVSGFAAGTSERLETMLADAMEQGFVADAAVAGSLAQTQAFWALRENMSESQKFEGGSLKHDVSVPIDRIPELVRRTAVLVEQIMPGCRPLPFGHFGDGNIHLNISQPPGMDKATYLARWREITGPIYALVTELNGSISAEHGIGRAKREDLLLVKPPVALDMMRAVKKALDPKGILNPGRIFE
jgi:FAD/FMN-containing dehydrogenase